MAFLGKLRSQRHYAAGTLHLQSLDQGATSSAIKELDSECGRIQAPNEGGGIFLVGTIFINQITSARNTMISGDRFLTTIPDGKGQYRSLNHRSESEL